MISLDRLLEVDLYRPIIVNLKKYMYTHEHISLDSRRKLTRQQKYQTQTKPNPSPSIILKHTWLEIACTNHKVI